MILRFPVSINSGTSAKGSAKLKTTCDKTRMRHARVKRTRHMLIVKGRAVDRLLQVHAVMDVVQEH